MANFNVILDIRLHRAFHLSPDGIQYNLAKPGSGYGIFIQNIAGADHLLIKHNTTLVADIKCNAMHIPPATGTPIGTITNPNMQKRMTLDDSIHRVIELQENISPAANGILILQNFTDAASLSSQDKLIYTPEGGTELQIETSTKIPPYVEF